jgi:hypothetical protein
MTEYGIKTGYILAGFFGGVASLRFIQGLTTPQAVSAVFTGAVGANYGTPAILYYVALPETVHFPLAFVVGLTALNTVPLLIKASEKINLDWIMRK